MAVYEFYDSCFDHVTQLQPESEAQMIMMGLSVTRYYFAAYVFGMAVHLAFMAAVFLVGRYARGAVVAVTGVFFASGFNLFGLSFLENMDPAFYFLVMGLLWGHCLQAGSNRIVFLTAMLLETQRASLSAFTSPLRR